jgi:putative phage-type endonuclease
MADLQRTDEWFAERLGKVTASRIADVRARTKTGWAAARKNYMADLIAERLSGEHIPGGTGAARRWGAEIEPEAKRAYEFYSDAEIVEVGFIPHPTIGNAGASPDGLVSNDGLVEFKCPTVLTHLETLETDAIAPEYLQQMQWQMACTGRQWCDFASYDPRYPEAMKLYVQRVKRDDEIIAAIEEDVIAFLAELSERIDRLRTKYEPETDELPEAARLLMAG